MCWQCDHPGATRQDYLDVLHGIVATNGWAVQYVETEPPFAYTVGLSGAGLPELLITGLAPPRSMLLLNTVAQYMRDKTVPTAGDTMTFPDGSCAEFVRVATPDAHLGWAVAFHGGPIRALQIAWRDARGHSPWCPDFNEGGPRQPVLGIRGPACG